MRFAGAALASLLAIACATVQERPGAVPGRGDGAGAILETVGDLAVVAMEPEGFDALSSQERLLAWQLAQAAMASHRLVLLQNYRHDAAIWDLVDGIHSRRQVLDPDFALRLADYRRRLFLHRGVHDAFTQEKFLPGFSREELLDAAARAVAAGARLGAGVAAGDLAGPIFDPAEDRFRVLKTPGPSGDPVKASAVNHYAPGVGVWELQALRDLFPRNSRVAPVEGRLAEQAYRAGAPGVDPGLGAPELAAAATRLEAAAGLAPPEEQEPLRALALALRTGSDARFEEHDSLWTPHVFPVDYALGFLETASDPRGLKGIWSGAVAVPDPLRTALLGRLGALAGFFEERLPWPAAWRRPAEAVRQPAASAVYLIATAGAFLATPPEGFTFPDAHLREHLGAKSWVLVSVADARERVLGDRLTREFVFPEAGAEAARCWRAVEFARVAAREVIGRSAAPVGSRTDPRLALAPYHSMLEEARAEALALYVLDDRRAVVAGLLPDAGCQTVLAQLAAMELLTGLLQVPRGNAVGHDHLRAVLLVQGWLREREAVRVVHRGGWHYAQVVDRTAWRQGLASLLETLLRIQAGGDRGAIEALVERHATTFDPALRDEVLARARHLGIPGRIAVLPPVLEPVRDAAGNLADVAARPARSVDDVIEAFARARAEAGLE